MQLPTWVRTMPARDSSESHRASTPLELFFDLCFVVAIAQAASSLHHSLEEDHIRDALIGYPMVIFAIWWAWMNFTWFATSFGTDDWLYRLLTFVQMGGVLVLAAGIGPAFEERDFTVLILSYVVMRVAMVTQWLRASRGAGRTAWDRATTRLYLRESLWHGHRSRQRRSIVAEEAGGLDRRDCLGHRSAVRHRGRRARAARHRRAGR